MATEYTGEVIEGAGAQEYTGPTIGPKVQPTASEMARRSAWGPSRVPSGGAISGDPLTGLDRADQKAREQEFRESVAYHPEQVGFSGFGAYGKKAIEGAAGGSAGGAILGTALGGIPGGLTLGIAGAPLGALSGIVEQGMHDLGFGSTTATLAGMVPIGGNAAMRAGQQGTKKVGDAIDSAKYLLPYKWRMALESDLNKTDAVLPETVRNLIRGAPESRTAEQAVGQSITRGVQSEAETQRLLAKSQEARTTSQFDKARQALSDRIQSLRGDLGKVKLAEQQANASQAAAVAGIEAKPPSELGSEMKDVLIKRKDDLEKARSTEYNQLLKDYVDFARGEQVAGRPFQQSEQGKTLIAKLESMLRPTPEIGNVRPLNTDQERVIEGVLADLKGLRKTADGGPAEIGKKGFKAASVQEDPEVIGTDIMALDTLVRELGDAQTGIPKERYKAIGQKLAGDLKRMVTEALYNWAPQGSKAKEAYRKASELIDPFKEGPGAKITKMSAKVRDTYTADAASVPETVFRSVDKVNGVIDALGGDAAARAQVQQFAQQHVNNKLSEFGGNIAKTEAWLNKPTTKDWMKAAGVEGHGQEYLAHLKDISAKQERLASARKSIEKGLERGLSGQQSLAENYNKTIANIRKSASSYEQRLADTVNTGKFDGVVLERILNQPTKKSVQVVSQLLDEGGIAALPGAVRQYMARSTVSNLKDRWNLLKPMLEHRRMSPTSSGAPLLNNVEMQKLDTDIQAALNLLGKTPTRKQLDKVAMMVSAKIGAAITSGGDQ